MFNKNYFFRNHFSHLKVSHENLRKSKEIFQFLKSDLKNFKIPVLKSYEKKYSLNFTSNIIKKFNKHNNIILIGMGGSILGTKSIYTFLKTKIKKNVFFFDNLDADLYIEFKKIKNLKNSCFIIVSKSGDTLETITNFCVVFSKSLIKNKLIIITEIKDSSLMRIANKYNAEIIHHEDFIGGRYSVLSEVGMLPSALMGLDVKKFRNLEKFINDKQFTSSLIQNVACMYSLNKKGIKNSVILNYESSLRDLCYWYQQLTAESLGKKGKGITPIISFGPKDHHSVLQLYLDGPKDKFFTFFISEKKDNEYKIPYNIVPNSMKFLKNKSLRTIINAQSKAVKKVFILKKIPFREIIVKKK